MLREVWVKVDEWPDYEVSNLGRVRSLKNPDNPVILKQFTIRHYPSVNFVSGLRRASKRVHRLVALAFLGPAPSERHIVRHVDGNPGNNRVDNLSWGTFEENEKDKGSHGTALTGERHHQSKLTENDVRVIRCSSQSCEELSKKFGVSSGHIYNIRRRRFWKTIA